MRCDTDMPAEPSSEKRRPSISGEESPSLTRYYVYMTEGCNLACRHCWLAPKFQKDGGSGGHLDYELFRLALDEGEPLGLTSVKLTGGEPLLHPEFLRFVDELKERELGLTIETNGFLLTREIARYLKEKSSLGNISVSLDGADATSHDDFRGVAGSFDRACRGVRYLAEAGLNPQIIMSLHSENVDHIEPAIKLARELGAATMKFNIIQSSGRGGAMIRRNQVLDSRKMVELGTWIEKELSGKYEMPLFYSWPMAFYGLKRLTNGNGGMCGIFNLLGILPSGHLSMCGIGKHIPDLCYGRLGENSVEEIWDSHPKLLELRENLPKKLEGVCADCLMRNKCLGHCAAETYFSGRKLTTAYWFCQTAFEEGLFPPSRLRR